MITYRVGLNKGVGLLLLCSSLLSLVTFFLVGSRIQLGLGLLLGLASMLYLLGPAFVVEIEQSGGGVVLMKNPFGITLRTHRFEAITDLTVRGSKIIVRRTDGERRTLGGFGVHGHDFRRLADYVRSHAGR